MELHSLRRLPWCFFVIWNLTANIVYIMLLGGLSLILSHVILSSIGEGQPIDGGSDLMNWKGGHNPTCFLKDRISQIVSVVNSLISQNIAL